MAARLVLPLALLSPVLAQAHGTLSEPKSRQYLCYKDNPENPSLDACKQAVQAAGKQQFYDWNGVRQGSAAGDHQAVVKDGTLCSGGNTSLGMDVPAPWPATTLTPNGENQVDFHYRITAPHATKYFRYYITRDNYNPEHPLRWSDLESEPFCDTGPGPAESGTLTHTCTLPASKTGRHLVYSIWQRSDSPEAFYACMDVNIPGDHTGTAWQDSGGDGIQGKTDLPAGSTATLRVFDTQRGADLEAHTLTIGDGMSAKHLWPYYLAQKVNRDSRRVNVGVLNDDGVVVPQKSATQNRVYGNAAKYNYAIDTRPADGGNPPPATGPSANAGADRTVVATTSSGFAYPLDGSRSTGDGLTYRWEAIDGPFSVRKADQAKAEAIVPKNSTGETTYRLTVTDKSGKQATSAAKVIAIAPQVAISGKSHASANERVEFSAKANFQGIPAKPVTYRWALRDASNQQVGSGSTQAWTTDGLRAGRYTVEVTAQSEHGMRSATASHAIEVSATEQPGGQCAPQWQAQSYPGGSRVTHRGRIYLAKWWAESYEEPGTSSAQAGQWADEGACGK